MALHFDLTKIAPERETLYPATEDGKMNQVTHTIILATMFAGVGRLVGDDAAEFYTRVSMYESLHGSLLMAWPEGDGDPVPRPITMDDVRAHEGLTTNVSKETRAAWVKRLCGQSYDERVRAYKQAAADAVAA